MATDRVIKYGIVMPHQNKGRLEVLTWEKVRKQVAEIKPDFAKIIDDTNPGDDHFFVKCTYPFGSKVLKDATFMIPSAEDGRLVPLTDPSVNKKIKGAMSYNLNSNPVSMVLKNSFEIYYPLEDRTIPLLNGLIPPGTIFGTFRVLHPEGSYQPKFLWEMTAGHRSMFMLPKITEAKKHMKIKKQFGLSVDKPMSLMSHWKVFKELSNHPDFPQAWNAEILFFSKKWFDHLDDKAWAPFYYYLHRLVWGGTEPWRNQPIWNLIFSLILQKYEAKPSAYVCDTVKCLMNIAIGAQSGFAPARNNIGGPIEGLQKIYQEEYGLKNYPPIIMSPAQFEMKNANATPAYYSLQFPTAMEFGKSSRIRTSLISDLHDIRALFLRYKHDILSNKYLTQDTPVHDLFNLVDLDYFHNNVELHPGMRSSKDMARGDDGLLTTLDGEEYKDFPDMCAFVKGCIRLSKKKL